MLFHTTNKDRGLVPAGAVAQPRLDLARVGVGLVFLVILLIAAFVAHRPTWPEAATALLHTVEVFAGGLAGVILGESMAVKG